MGYRILVVEDNAVNRILLRELLRYHGHIVLEASDGEEGVQVANSVKPDLILMDIQMKNVSGLTAIKMLKENPLTSQIKIVAVTSFAMSGDREKIMAAGADEYLSKPIDTRSLNEIVTRLMNQKLC